MWEYGLSNFPFVPVEAGLNRRISYILPSRIPQHSVRLLNASATREHWECTGLPELLARNTASYPFHLPNTRLKWQGHIRSADRLSLPRTRATRDASHFKKRFKDSSIPHDVLADLILEENKLQESDRALRSEQQGNALRAAAWNDHQVVFYPTGELLHQVQLKRRRAATTHWRVGCDQPIDVVNPIQQIDLLGTIDPSKPPRVVVRGAAACHVIGFRGDEFADHTVTSIQFPSMLHHVAPSPHVDDEFSCLSTSGKLFSWTAAGGAQVVGNATPHQRWLRCEYSSHPCVLWVANRHAVGSYDYRSPAPQGFNCTDWLIDYFPTPTEIIDIRRHPSCPFQLVVRTDTSLDILDVRSPHKSIVQWRHADLYPPTVTKAPHTIGTLDVVDISTRQQDRAMIVSGSSISNKVAVHWYVGHTSDDPTAQSIRGAVTAASQVAAADASFDIHLPDTTPWVHQIGASALRTSDNSCDVFQLTSLGDLFVQTIQHSSSERLHMQANVPCGRAMRATAEDNQRQDTIQMPLKAKAFVPEHDASSLQPFRLLPVAKLQRVLTPADVPLLPSTDPLEDLPGRLEAILTPSATLVALMQTYTLARPGYAHLVDAVAALPQVMLRFVSPNARSAQHTLRRLATESYDKSLCGCHAPATAFLESSPPPIPCDDARCPLPHMWIVHATPPEPPSTPRKHNWRPTPLPATNNPIQYDAMTHTTSHAQVVADLEAVYGHSTDALPSSPRRVKQQQMQTQFSW